MRQALRSLDRSYRKAFDKELRGIGRPIVNEAKQNYRRIYPADAGAGARSAACARPPAAAPPRSCWAPTAIPTCRARSGAHIATRSSPLAGAVQGSLGYFFWPRPSRPAPRTVDDNIVKLVDRANALAFPGVG